MRNIRGVDIELLVTLETLLTTCNVTLAARHMHLSQPAVSVRLKKLRQLFGDPLLVPGSRGMQPTTRGLELLTPLREALSGVEHMLGMHTPFDPAHAEFTWHVAAADYGQHAILMPQLAGLRRDAPGIGIATHAMDPAKIMRKTEAGDIDLVIAARDTAPDGLRSATLFTEHYQLIARKRHPLLRGKPTLAEFCALDHVIVSPAGGGFRGATDTLLEARRCKRRVVLSVSSFLLLPDLVRHSDMVAMVPSRLLVGHSQGLQLIESPIRPPGFEMAIFWHERVHADHAHAWLRSRIMQSAGAAPRS